MTYSLIRTKLQVWDMILDAPAVGHVRVVPTVGVVLDAAGNRVLASPNTVYLDEDGWFEADLVPSDELGLNPSGFGYTFEVRTKAIQYDFTTQVRLEDSTLVTETDPVTQEEFTHYELMLAPLAPVLPDARLDFIEGYYNLGNVSGALSLSRFVPSQQVFALVATGDITLAPEDMPVVPPNKAGSFTLKITQDAQGFRLLTIDPAIRRSYGVDILLSEEPTAVDLLTFLYDGSEWNVLLSGKRMS